MKYIIKRERFKNRISFLVWYNEKRKEYGWGDKKSAIEFSLEKANKIQTILAFPTILIERG